MEARCEEAESGRREDGEESEAEINSLLVTVEKLTTEKQGQAQELREQQCVCDTIAVERENWEAEKESFDKELKTLREESSDKFRTKNKSLLEEMDELKQEHEAE